MLARAALVLSVSLLVAAPAAAQLTTGTLAGTVKDAQGGVIPGATVTLTSEARGTQLSPAVTNTQGDFVIANVAPDTYTIQVSMDGSRRSSAAAFPSVPATASASACSPSTSAACPRP